MSPVTVGHMGGLLFCNRGLYCYAYARRPIHAYASHYALLGIRKLGVCTSLASPNASHYAARRTPPPSEINKIRQYIHVIIACVTVRWPCGCLIRTTCHVYGLWISAGAPRPAGGRGVFDVSRIRITHTSFSPQSFARGTVQWPARRASYNSL